MEQPKGLGWGVLVNRWHDEGRTAHLLRGDNSPACGVAYYTATRRDVQGMTRCKRCEHIAALATDPAQQSLDAAYDQGLHGRRPQWVHNCGATFERKMRAAYARGKAEKVRLATIAIKEATENRSRGERE